jgi:hypothetical protein
MIKKLMIIVLLASSYLVFGHGIDLSVGKKYPCVFVKAEYAGSNAVAFAEVKVTYENQDTEFQKGSTDKNGAFAFCPDQTGKWTVTVDDLMGHRKSVEIIVDQAFMNPAPISQPETKASEDDVKKENVKEDEVKTEDVKQERTLTTGNMCCYLLKIVLGVLLILLITFIFYRWNKKNET